MRLLLKGKLAVVTGSTRGIGLATAKGLVQMGAEVILNGRTQSAIDRAVSSIRKDNKDAKLHGVAADLSNASGCAAVIGAFPEVDILVNNMGVYEPKSFFDVLDEDWEWMFNANVMSGVRLTRHYLQRMLDKKNWGRAL